MKKFNWNKLIHALVLVKIGQDLGTNCQLTQTLHTLIELLATFFSATAHI